MKVLNMRDLSRQQQVDMYGDGPVAYVARPSQFGNPFVIGRDGDRASVIRQYEAWLLVQPRLVELARRHLKGMDLVCWCAPLACHADVLLRIANEEV
jgi:hypothetical protein